MIRKSSGYIYALPCLLAGVLGSCKGAKTPLLKHPNIIVIMTDDQSVQSLSCYGSKLIQTPNIDMLAKEGMRFQNCFVTNSVSGPSRACILTGKFSHINGFTDNSQTFNGDQETFPKLLQKEGYQTAMIGKWHLNSDPQGFDFWSILIGHGDYYNPDFIENGKKHQEMGYVTDLITDKTINFIKQRDPDRPFAVLCYHKASHRNWMPAQRHLGYFNHTTFPEPPTLRDNYLTRSDAARQQLMMISRDMWLDYDLKVATPEELSIKVAQPHIADINKADVAAANKMGQGLDKMRAAYGRMTSAEQTNWNKAYSERIKEAMQLKASGKDMLAWKYQQYLRDYLATILAVDENVGRLINYLKKTGQLDNTLIIFTSDQGFFLGEHGWFDKRFMYDESLRMPLIVRYPDKIKAGSVTNALAMNVDFAPTILDMAGVKIPQDMQGESLKPILVHSGTIPENWRKSVYYHYYEYPSWHMVKRHYGIRTDRYKLIHFYNDIDAWEMYDLKKDPYEINNLYGKAAFHSLQDSLMHELRNQQFYYNDNDPDEKNSEFFKPVKD